MHVTPLHRAFAARAAGDEADEAGDAAGDGGVGGGAGGGSSLAGSTSGVWKDEEEERQAQRERLEDLKHEMHVGREKLQLVASVSALIAGFSVVALIELNLNALLSPALLMVYTLLSCILIALHLSATMMAVCILPTIALVDRMSVKDPSLLSYYDRYKGFVETAWFFSMGAGIILFFAELVVVVWIQVGEYAQNAAIAASALSVPIFALFIYVGIQLNRRESMFMDDIVQRRQSYVEAQVSRLQRLTTGLTAGLGDREDGSAAEVPVGGPPNGFGGKYAHVLV